MPHFDSPQRVQHITYRLADSLPSALLSRLEAHLHALPGERQELEKRLWIEDWIDAGHGSCLLRNPAAASLVQDAFLFFDGVRYRLFAWVVMPNHVHVLFQAHEGWTIARIVASWKSFTGRRLRALETGSTSRRGIWQREYWDRYIRDEHHFLTAKQYLHQNPVKAGLVRMAEDWEWSSARLEADRLRESD